MDRVPSAIAGPSNSPPSAPSVVLTERKSSRNALSRTYLDGVGAAPVTPRPKRDRDRSGSKGKEPLRARVPRERRVRPQNSEGASDPRHSHGLSWSSTTRDSVVDNMLLSLDHLSPQDISGTDALLDDALEEQKSRNVQAPNIFHSPKQRPRGHTYSSSFSSSYDHHVDSPATKYAFSHKGRRSNSSSSIGFHSAVTSRTYKAQRTRGSERTSADTQRARRDHTTHESSDLDSIDGYSSIAAINRANWARHKSASLDDLYAETEMNSSVMERGRPVPSVHSKYEAPSDPAPEPMVPAGPRKMQNPQATGPVYVNSAPNKAVRKVNTQNDLRSAIKSHRFIPQDVRDQASDFVLANSVRGIPSMPHPHQHSAPAPSPGFQSSSRRDAVSPHRERPGFFKRMFGGASSRTSSGFSERSDAHDPPAGPGEKQAPSNTSKSRASSSQDNSSASRSGTRQASKEHTPAVSYPPPSLNKKSSSFFRRRKKSMSENEPLPALPVSNVLNYNVKSAQPSPSASSLRKVMDPYLTTRGMPAHSTSRRRKEDSRPTTQESPTEDSDDLDMFHSGYTPPPDASLGRHNPFSHDRASAAKDSGDTTESPKMRIKLKKRQAEEAATTTQHLGEGDFPHDHSGEPSAFSEGHHFVHREEQPRVSPMSVSPLSEQPPPVDTKHTERPPSRASTGDMIIESKVIRPNGASEEARNLNPGTNVSINPNSKGLVTTRTPAKSNDTLNSQKSERLYLKPTESEENGEDSQGLMTSTNDSQSASRAASQKSPQPSMQTAMQSPAIASEQFHSATSLPLPTVQVEGNEVRKSTEVGGPSALSPVIDPDAEYRERARRIFEGDEEDVTKGEAAAWLGEKNTLSTRTLRAYMQLFDFAGMNMLYALRALCGKLLLKGETQQFDRIITALSARWCECNPNHGLKAQDVVHTIIYSLILLNTDLHLADIGEKMSRYAYVRNTLPTIKRVALDAAPNAFDEIVRPSPQSSRPSIPWMDATSSVPGSPTCAPPETQNERSSFENSRPQALKRMSIRPGIARAESDGCGPDSSNASNALVANRWQGPMRGWEFEIEMILKSFFNSIRSDPLPLVRAPASETAVGERNLTVSNMGGLKRSGSVASKAPSDNMSYRSMPGFRTMTMGWQNKNNRSRPKLYPASTAGSSRTSFDDGNSMWSPAQSSNWSKGSIAKTLTSASVGSLGYHFTPSASDYKHSIGFANALSHAIIREESAGAISVGDGESLSVPSNLLEDEALALEGAPWAKEGLVKHKYHLETPDRKAKERNWADVFAVIGEGRLTLFNFNTSAKSHSMGRKSHGRQAGRVSSIAGARVGGGDWMENAEQLEVFVLRHTIASTLPPPGYSKSRPYVWALSLPSGAVHLFQVGTPQIADEFMSTANYWSARLSKEPLANSVSNVEYGWSDQVINTALAESRTETQNLSSPSPSVQSRTPGHMHSNSGGGALPRQSLQSSIRGSFDTGFGTGKSRTPGYKAQITEWHAPTQSMMASQLLEVDQLRSLTTYVGNVEAELAMHNDLKHAIELAYSPRHPNHGKALANWQRKSDHLLREIVKFRTYIDALSAAQKAKEDFDKRKAEQEFVAKGGISPVDSGRAKEDSSNATPKAPHSPTAAS